MEKFKILLGLLTVLTLTVFGQKNEAFTFDIKDFNQKAEIAGWLCVYDAVAWRTSDSVMAQDSLEIKKLGNEWFCFQTSDKNWHAVYGKYNKNNYDLVFHYLVDTTNMVMRVREPIDTLFLNSHSRALITANKQIKSIRDSADIRFNQYIKQNIDKTFTVWIFPAFQTNDYAVYGGEFIYLIDKTGNKILKDDSYCQGRFRAFKVGKPREVWLDYTELEKPTLGTVFFVWYYKKYFTYIKLENKNHITTTFKDDKGSYYWVHVEKKKTD